jgi:hypothetical protein
VSDAFAAARNVAGFTTLPFRSWKMFIYLVMAHTSKTKIYYEDTDAGGVVYIRVILDNSKSSLRNTHCTHWHYR